MNQELTVQQTKAVALRDYLQRDTIKDQLAAALPKWLSPDRLLRIVFSSTMKNPKLLDCTRESILQSVMQCAQLGLEPILGRAYLIPYENRNASFKPVIRA
jgi:recombination protein RecT